jgi:hypothetical protein
MLNKDSILEWTNKGLDVFKHYISGKWRVGRNFLNPLYEDQKASCNIYFNRRSQSYKMKDFAVMLSVATVSTLSAKSRDWTVKTICNKIFTK